MKSLNGNIYCVTGLFCGEFTDDQWRGALVFSLICAWINGWVNNREASDLRRHQAHYGAILMNHSYQGFPFYNDYTVLMPSYYFSLQLESPNWWDGVFILGLPLELHITDEPNLWSLPMSLCKRKAKNKTLQIIFQIYIYIFKLSNS